MLSRRFEGGASEVLSPTRPVFGCCIARRMPSGPRLAQWPDFVRELTSRRLAGHLSAPASCIAADTNWCSPSEAAPKWMRVFFRLRWPDLVCSSLAFQSTTPDAQRNDGDHDDDDGAAKHFPLDPCQVA